MQDHGLGGGASLNEAGESWQYPERADHDPCVRNLEQS